MTERHRILVVDDEHLNRTVLSGLLKAEHTVIVAKNGEQALARLKSDSRIDLVLLDVMMPGISGYDVLRWLKNADGTRDIPVIFVTALTSTEDEERGLKLGAADYVVKPFHPAVVRARVENHLRFVRQRKILEELVGRDGLTEIDNRRRFDEVLDREWRRSRRTGHPLSLAMIDVDYFKAYNDAYGHAVGDRALKSVAQALTGALNRPADMVARYGGEEFAVLMPETDVDGAGSLAECLRLEVQSLDIPHGHSPVTNHLSVSIGGATMVCTGEDPMDLVHQADSMLYRAKQDGRNRVIWQATA